MTATLARQRLEVRPGSKPRLPRHVRLQFEPVRQAWALLSPEKVMWPDEVSHDILKRCNGTTTVAQIVRELATEYDAPEETIRGDVLGFLQTWADRKLVLA
jgi:pyrroloquinoline quinone biosynthesis protein D